MLDAETVVEAEFVTIEARATIVRSADGGSYPVCPRREQNGQTSYAVSSIYRSGARALFSGRFSLANWSRLVLSVLRNFAKEPMSVNWLHEANGRLILCWTEMGGPAAPVQTPTRQGFGSRVIERMIGQLKGKTRFD